MSHLFTKSSTFALHELAASIRSTVRPHFVFLFELGLINFKYASPAVFFEFSLIDAEYDAPTDLVVFDFIVQVKE